MAFNPWAQPDLFRFSLISGGVQTFIENAPNQWNQQEFSNKRDLEYFGLIKNYVTELEFVRDSARLIRQQLYENGVDAAMRLRIERLNKSTREYFVQYEGDVDFSTAEDELTKVIANLIDGGVTAKVQAYRNVKYEYPFTENDVRLNLGTVNVNEWARFFAAGNGENSGPQSTNAASFILATQNNESSIVLGGIEPKDQEFVANVRPSVPQYDFSTSSNYFFKANVTKQVRIRGSMRIKVRQIKDLWYQINIVDSSSPIGSGAAFLFSTFTGRDQDETFEQVYNFDLTMNVFAGRNYFLVVERASIPSSGNITPYYINVIQSTIDLTYTDSTEPVTVDAKKPNILFKEMVSKMNGVDTDVQSFLLDNWDNLLVTSGNAIRTFSDATIKSSFDSFYRSVRSILSAGYGVQNGLPTIEEIGYFFDDTELIQDFGEVSDIKIAPLTDVMNSSIKVGYEKYDYEIEQGLEEFNNGQEYSTPIVRVQTTLDIRSEYRADQYGIDQIRIREIQRLANVNNTDIPSDNDVFVVLCYKEPVNGMYQPIGPEYFDSYPQGVSVRANSYNYLLSPKHNLIRNMSFIKSMFYGLNAAGSIDFQSADKNANLVVVKDGVMTAERSNLNLADYPDRLFLPFTVEFNTDYKTSIQDLINTNINGVVRFMYQGVQMEGFIYSVELSASQNAETTFTVILSKNNNLQQLIF